jgi:peptidoglycan/xylan/chitin deacetylase (PgdA/CDA1 family)
MDHTVCVTYDFDAVSAWLGFDMPAFHEWGVYGAETAAPRLLDLHDRHGIPSTWFVPGHTIESFPAVCGDVHDRGHEIQHHGWSHEALPSFESRTAERADFERGIDAVYDLTGRKPDGFRNPAGGFSEHTVGLLEEFGFEWDSSQGIRDLEPYYLREQSLPVAGEPYRPGEPTDIVELPTLWHRDDWLQLFPVVSGPEYVSYGYEDGLVDRWRRELDWARERLDAAVLVLLLHPQCAGRAAFLGAFEPFLEEVAARPDVRFADLSTVAAEYAGSPPAAGRHRTT